MSRRARRFAVAALAVAATLAVGVAWWVRNPLAAFAAARRWELGRAGFERATIGEAGNRLTYLAAGSGPPLLFFHGLGDEAATWAKVAPAFVDRYRVVLPDLPGHGASEPAAGELAMATIVAGAERLLAATAPSESTEPAILVGNSLGAWVATLLAHRHPERVARLVLINGGPLRGEPGAPSLVPRDRREAGQLMSLLRDPGAPPIPGFVLDDVVRRAASGPLGRLPRDLDGLTAHLLDGRLGEVATPADLVWGLSDQVMTRAYADRLLAALPAARLTPLERCGHVPQLECPKRLGRVLGSLLAAPPPTAGTAGLPAPPLAREAATP